MSVLPETMAIDAPAQRGPVLGFVIRLLREKPFGAAAGMVFVLFVFCGVFANVLAPYGFNEIAPLERLRPPSWKSSVWDRQSRPGFVFTLPIRRKIVRHYWTFGRRDCHCHFRYNWNVDGLSGRTV